MHTKFFKITQVWIKKNTPVIWYVRVQQLYDMYEMNS